jgi:hypothetical protein
MEFIWGPTCGHFEAAEELIIARSGYKNTFGAKRRARVVLKAEQTERNQHSTQGRQRGTSCCEGGINRRKPTINPVKTT